jgi:hypothetical protein
MMITSAFRIPEDLYGTVAVYPLTPEIMAAFDRLATKWRGRGGNEHATAPYASLATALTAVTAQPVVILPRPRERTDPHWLITTAPIDPGTLHMATKIWERLAGGRDTLGPLVAAVRPRTLRIADDVHRAPGRASAANWVYRVLAWNLASALASRPVDFDGRQVTFRMDTQGSLIAWDDPIRHTGRDGTAQGLVRISFAIETIPGESELVAIPTISLTRLVSDLRKVKWAWIDHGRPTLLRLPIARRPGDDGWESVFADFSASVVEECGLSPLPWGENVLVNEPDRVRAWRSVNWNHALGTGVGARTYRRFLEHVTAVSGATPLCYDKTDIKVQREIDRAPLSSLDDSVPAAGYDRLRIVHLSASSASRERVRLALRPYQTSDAPELPATTGVEHRLTDRGRFVSYDLPELLAHGDVDRTALLAAAPLLRGEPGTLVLALVDTEHDPRTHQPEDAKPALRLALARIGVPSQFLAIAPGSVGSIDPKATDYAATTALRDLVRAGGLTDERLAQAVRMSPHPLEREVWLVGVHVRVQNAKWNGRARNDRPLLVTTLVALRARPSGPWDLCMYVRGRGWVRHAEGLTAFHAGSIGDRIDERQAAFTRLRGYVDNALAELPGDLPVVVMTDADATRRVWSGLSNGRLREGVLPGDGLAWSDRVAVVRVGVGDEAVPRPIHCTDGRPSADPKKPTKPRNRLYRGTDSWLLGHSSRLFNEGSKGRVGADFTRFTLPANRAGEQRNNWHAFTATEFVVARPGSFTEEAVVALTARLCAQPLSWDAQTRRPLPLHLAVIADMDHPAYRTEQPEDDGR